MKLIRFLNCSNCEFANLRIPAVSFQEFLKIYGLLERKEIYIRSFIVLYLFGFCNSYKKLFRFQLFYFFKIRETYIFISYVKELLRDFRRSWIQVLKQLNTTAISEIIFVFIRCVRGQCSFERRFWRSVLTNRRTMKYLSGCNFSSWHRFAYTRGEVETLSLDEESLTS